MDLSSFLFIKLTAAEICRGGLYCLVECYVSANWNCGEGKLGLGDMAEKCITIEVFNIQSISIIIDIFLPI